MVKLILTLMICVVLGAADKNHPKFRRDSDKSYLTPETCTNEINKKRNEILEKSRCAEPREVFVPLKPNWIHEQVIPGYVWIKRCVGFCSIDGRYDCLPHHVTIRHLAVRLNNLDTKKESCVTYAIEEHLSCQCCSFSESNCNKTEVVNPDDLSHYVQCHLAGTCVSTGANQNIK